MTTDVKHETLATDLVSGPVEYATLRAGDPGGDPGLLLFLHGGGQSRDSLEEFRPVFEQAWATGVLPPMVVATPSAGRSFYLDDAAGDSWWEQFIVDEFIPHLQATEGTVGLPSLTGFSMGGLGSLRMAFRRPDRFAVVAALEPAIETTADWDALPVRDRFYRPMELMHELYGDPIDREHFRRNSPLHLATTNHVAIAASGLAILVECGDEDALELHRGAEVLHRALFDRGIDHEYRSVRGANHIGATTAPRLLDALSFIGRSLTPAQPDEQLEMTVPFFDAMRRESGYERTVVVEGPAGPVEARLVGEGPAVVMLPSLGRSATDFDDLARRLARHGYLAVAPEPRGINGSTGELEGLTMFDLAADVAAMIRSLDIGPATIVGHAFGNRVARMTATEYPHLVESLVLLACGGSVAPDPDDHAALLRVFDAELPDDEHLAAVDQAFFAPGNDASVWTDGWHGTVASFQGLATSSLDAEHWVGAGASDVLIVQPSDDVIAPPANAEAAATHIGPRATVLELPHAGHAVLPEQPRAVATAVLGWLRDRGR
ncbi:MAG: alpha/beta fold hydrolase [Actinomycetota bacterium]